ncbi:unnamed protein product [Phytophthora fragariaefolia]|uniref:Unnamed protein product n=1 Tax=Phytophthora fragariaefolia TaxID=1490495 RepID=A0A9W6WUM1_9STRA|nr:unnamed protein product [Phytophthora fragariaefolia]
MSLVEKTRVPSEQKIFVDVEPARRSLCKLPSPQHQPQLQTRPPWRPPRPPPPSSQSPATSTRSPPTSAPAAWTSRAAWTCLSVRRSLRLARKILFVADGAVPADALIKERRKEHKLLKKEEAKKQKQPAHKRKTPKQQKQQPQKTQTNGQAAQRSALVNKNRGLPAQPSAARGKTAQNKAKTSIAATTAKLRQQMRADKAAKNSPNRLVASPRTVKSKNQSNAAQQQKKKKNAPPQARKITSPARVVQPKGGNELQPLRQQSKTPVKPSARQVMRSNNKKSKLSITIPGSASKKNAQKKQKPANKVLLPGKLSQTLAKKNSAAKTIVKRAKNRKVAAGKAAQVVRQVPGQRRKN